MRLNLRHNSEDLLLYKEKRLLKRLEKNLMEAAYYLYLGLTPHERILVSDFMATSMWLRRAVNPNPGFWNKELTPYLIQIADDLSPFKTFPNKVILIKAVQVGGSILGVGWILSILTKFGGPCAAFFAKDELLKRVSKKYFRPIIRDCQELQKLKLEHKLRTGENDKESLYNYFSPIADLRLGNAESSVTLRGSPDQWIWATEISNFTSDSQGEGDPVDLIEGRGSAFGDNHKVFFESSPTDENCRITKLYGEEDCRRFEFYIKCPHCMEYQVLRRENAVLNLAEDPYFICTHKHCKILESDKDFFLNDKAHQPKWIAENFEATSGRTHGYHLPSFYAPSRMLSWKKIREKWVNIKGDINKAKAFCNQYEGKAYNSLGEDTKVDKNRIETYRCNDPSRKNPLPPKVVALFAGADLNGDKKSFWLPIQVIGITTEEKTYVIDYKIFNGDARKQTFWKNVYSYLNKSYTTESGVKLKIAVASFDVNYEGNLVLPRVKAQPLKHCLLVAIYSSGRNNYKEDIINKNAYKDLEKRTKDKLKYGTYQLKNFTQGRLQITNKENDYYVHLTSAVLKEEPEYFDQLVVEKKVMSKNSQGYKVIEFKKPDKARNEAFITLCYGYFSFKLWSQVYSLKKQSKKIYKEAA